MIDTTVLAAESRTRRKPVRFSKAADIYRDLAAGEISVRTTLDELSARYGRDPWRDYKEALRDYGYDHGCLVLVDDENGGRYISMMEHFGRDIAPEEASAYFSGPLSDYLDQARAADKESLPDNVVRLHRRKSTRYSVYRLPFGDYSKDEQAFFDERGEFIWQTYA
jgi:hypothetical protein